VVVVVDGGHVRLDEPGDCKRFHVLVVGERRGDALAAENAGRFQDDDTAFVSIDAVRRLAGGGVADGWADDFAAMLAFAGTKGWLADGGTTIQAHVERG
jgi:hypothetical protein